MKAPSAPTVVEIPVEPAEQADGFILRAGVAAIWLATAAACLHPWYQTIGGAYLVPLSMGREWIFATCALEAALGLYLLLRRPGPLITLLQLGMVAFFTATLAAIQPELLHHPLGMLSKNVPILGAVFAAYALYRPPLKEMGRIALWLVVAFIWIHEGLVPKILFPSALEIGWVEGTGLSPIPGQTAVFLVGLFEVAVGLLLIVPGVSLAARRWTLIGQIALMVILPIPVLAFSPEFAVHPFMPLGKNLPLIAASIVLVRQTTRGLGPWVQPFFTPVPRTNPSPFSRLSSDGGFVGGGFFARRGLIDEGKVATGLLDDLATLRWPGFDPDHVAPLIRRFYERTGEFAMEVEGAWRPPFSFLAPLFRRLYSRRYGQFGLPLPTDPDGPLESAIVPLKDELDGRRAVRGWVRTKPSLDLTVYAAAYSELHHGPRPMMSVAFVQPFGSLTTVLEPSNVDGDGVRLSTCTDAPLAGNFLVLLRGGRGWAVKLPFLHEQLEVRRGDGETLEAVHMLWMFGVPYLTMRYRCVPM